MDLGPALKVAPPPTSAPVSPASSALGSLVPNTELAPAQVVLPAGAAGATDLDPRRSGSAVAVKDTTDRRITIDPDTQEIVHQTIDARTHDVVDQLPDRAMLGLRAYFERLAERSAARSTAEGSEDHSRVVRIQA